jgi:hypothetical protein
MVSRILAIPSNGGFVEVTSVARLITAVSIPKPRPEIALQEPGNRIVSGSPLN